MFNDEPLGRHPNCRPTGLEKARNGPVPRDGRARRLTGGARTVVNRVDVVVRQCEGRGFIVEGRGAYDGGQGFVVSGSDGRFCCSQWALSSSKEAARRSKDGFGMTEGG